MKLNKLLLFFSILLILIISIGSISAANNLNDSFEENFLTENANEDLVSSDNSVSDLETYEDENSLMDSSDSNTIIVPFDKYNPNEVLLPKIQPAINSAKSGDTVIIEGSPVHCHLTINKTLTVKAVEGNTIDSCPHHTHEGLEEHGVFYITGEGSGSVIEGFNFINKDKAETPFAIIIDGATNVTIKDCTINYDDSNVDKCTGIFIKNADNVILSNLLINNTIKGITIINSSDILINNSIFSNIETYGISVDETSRKINIVNNSIINNDLYGITLDNVDDVNVLNNLIRSNGLKNSDNGSGIYVNSNITKFTVKGNIFLENNLHAIMYDYKTENLDSSIEAEDLTDIDDNFFSGHQSMILHHRIFTENGNEAKERVYMKKAFIYSDTPCGFTYYSYNIPWTLDAPANNGKYDYSLKLNIEEIQNGVYKISIADNNGNIATGFNSFYFNVFLNDFKTVEPQNGDVCRKVLIENGVAVADFRSSYDSFKSSGNKITAILPLWSDRVDINPSVNLTVSDSKIPINPATKLTATKLTTYPISDSYFSVKLVDSKGKAISNQKVSIKFNGKVYNVKTNSNGIAKAKVSLTAKKTYTVNINYAGNDNYKASSATGKIVVKTGSKKAKITASNIKAKVNKKTAYTVKLTASNGKALSSQKVTIKVNGKTYTVKTNKKGIAKVSLKLSKAKKYKATIKFLGNANYKAVSKTSTITVTKK